MSAIYFHSEQETAAIRGSERAYMGNVCAQTGLAFLDLSPSGGDQMKELLPQGHYLRTSGDRRFADDFRVWFSVGMMDGFVLPDGETVEPWIVGLNTAAAIGGDALRLMARLHGQCEVHAYAEEANREWLAGIMDEGHASGLYREDQGWENVAALLRNGNGGPVVTSYSVTDSFPNARVTGYEDDDAYEAWHELPRNEQWSTAFEGLRASGGGLEMTPENWPEFRFATGHTAMDIAKIAAGLRMEGATE